MEQRLLPAAPLDRRPRRTVVGRFRHALAASIAPLPAAARLYLLGVFAAAVAAGVPALARLDGGTDGWGTFALLAAGLVSVQLFRVRGPQNQSYDAGSAFALAGVLLLPVELVALLGVMHLATGWRIRRTWYVVTFNVCNWLLAMLATWAVLHASRAALDSVLPAGPADAVTTAVGIVVFIALPELLLAVALRLAAEQPFRDAALLDRTTQTIELVLAVVAVAMAEFWRHDPWLAPFALAPLLIVQRSLHVPKLQKEVRLDAKTGLFNALHFKEALAGELARAERLNRPVSILLADLDLLRKVNNTYGHLAGDAVLTGVADVFRTVLRRGDVAARFGGEEFAVLLPDTPLESALALAERLRAAVATRVFVAPASGAAVRATLSIGVAERAAGLTDPERLIHEADLAVYRAKAAGRNRTAAARAA